MYVDPKEQHRTLKYIYICTDFSDIEFTSYNTIRLYHKNTVKKRIAEYRLRFLPLLQYYLQLRRRYLFGIIYTKLGDILELSILSILKTLYYNIVYYYISYSSYFLYSILSQKKKKQKNEQYVRHGTQCLFFVELRARLMWERVFISISSK